MKKLSLVIFALLVCYAVFYFSSIKFAQVDKVYYINLDRSTDTKERMLKNLTEAALISDSVRFNAYDGKNVIFIDKNTGNKFSGEEYLSNHLSPQGHFYAYCTNDPTNRDFIEVKYQDKNFNGRLPGEVGCICSHKKVWQETILNNYKNVLILEDDINFIPNFPNLFERALDNAPKDYDLLYLNVENFGKAYKSQVKNEYARIFMNFFDQHIKNPFWRQVHKNTGSAKAYIVSQEGAKKLLECSNRFYKKEFIAIDVLISRCIEEKTIIAYASKPKLAHGIKDINSDIGE